MINKKRSTRKTILMSGLILLSLSLFTFPLTGCGDDEEDEQQEEDTGLNYSEGINWLAQPDITKSVDVFYVYPTVSSNESGAMNIYDDAERALAEGIFKAQASVFQGSANVFAPFYRQMSTKVKMPEGGLATDTKEFKQGAVDVQDAFEYYITKINPGRPFIIAGHSQGTMALIELIKNRFGNDQALRDRMVAAYLIGYTVTDSDLQLAGLAAAQGADDIGVVITYNTQSTTSEGGPMLMSGAHCINPLNWKTDDTPADSLQNFGARFYNDETGELIREIPNYCGAQIQLIPEDKIALTTNIVDTLVIGPYSPGVYHRFDYAFWYRNLELNVATRIEAYLSKK